MPLPMVQSKNQVTSTIKSIIGIAAGKGGVGKSCVTVNLALALVKLGFKVGVMDTDLYGPSIRRMLPEEQMPLQNQERITPAVCRGIKIISMAYFRREDEAAVVRAPIANGIIQQFIKNVDWGDLDFLLIDFPPGTGDIQLTLSQNARLKAALMVTTPQEVALMDVRKAMGLFHKVKVPVVGILENMSYYQPPGLPKMYPLGQGGGASLAQETGFPLIGEVPLNPELSRCGDEGISVFEQSNPEAQEISKIFLEVAKTFLGYLKVLENRQSVDVEKIVQKDKHTFTVEWSDGLNADFRLSELQMNCPCAGCNDEETGKSLVDPASIPYDQRASAIDPVGHYALKIHFNSGCTKGIYSFDFLRRLAEGRI